MRKVKILAVLFLFLFLSACALIQSDPVGTSLLTFKTIHGSLVNSAADAYLAGRIDQKQMIQIRNAGRKFDQAYQVAVSLHAAQQLKEGDEHYKETETALASLKKLVNDLVTQQVK